MKRLLAFVISIALTGCATYNVHQDFSYYAKSCAPYFKDGGPTATYGGTMRDIYIIYTSGAFLLRENPPEPALTIFVVASVDLPLSFLADTVLIPVSIPRDVIRVVKC